MEVKFKSYLKGLLVLWPQWLAGFEVWLLMTLVGATLGWTSPFIGKLSRPSPPFEVSKEDITWIASLNSIARPVGIFLSMFITFLFGSKKSLYIPALSFVCSWIFLAIAPSIEYVFISYICNGISMGSLFNTFPLYIGEIANPSIRGRLSSLVIQGFMFGYLSGNLIGTHLSLLSMSIIASVPTFLFLLTFTFFPDTPYSLVRKKDSTNALKAIKFYNPDVDPSKELENLEAFLASSPKASFIETIKRFKIPVNRNTLIIVNVIYSIIQLNGIITLLEYMEVLFTEARINVVTPATMVTLISVAANVSSWLCFLTSDRFGRTTILSVSMLAMSLTLFAWGFNYHLYDLGYNEPNLQWITIIASIIYRAALVLGFLPIVPTIISEIFAPDVKNIGSTACNITSAIFTFISSKTFQYLVDNMTYKYVFYLFGAISLVVAGYTKICIPETKGKSLQEIQDMMNERYSGKNERDTGNSKSIHISTKL